MEILTKPLKFKRIQITKIIDKFGNPKVQLRYYYLNEKNKIVFNRCQQIYFEIDDWEMLKDKIRASG